MAKKISGTKTRRLSSNIRESQKNAAVSIPRRRSCRPTVITEKVAGIGKKSEIRERTGIVPDPLSSQRNSTSPGKIIRSREIRGNDGQRATKLFDTSIGLSGFQLRATEQQTSREIFEFSSNRIVHRSANSAQIRKGKKIQWYFVNKEIKWEGFEATERNFRVAFLLDKIRLAIEIYSSSSAS